MTGPFLLPCYQLGSQPSTAMFHSEENGSKGMDPLVLIDAIAICMAYEEKELCKIGEVALAVIFDVASIILGSKERVNHSKKGVGDFSFSQSCNLNFDFCEFVANIKVKIVIPLALLQGKPSESKYSVVIYTVISNLTKYYL